MISIIIRVQEGEHLIGYCIQSVLDSYIDNPEIIIINDNADRETIDIVKSFTFSDIEIFDIDSYSPGKALNYGVKKATNEYILILSSHCTLTKMLNTTYRLNNFVAIFGKQIPIWRGKKINSRNVWSNFKDEVIENPFSKLEDRYFLHNACAMYSKKILTKNPFNETLHSKEDRYWANNMINNGYKILYDPNLECHHHWTVKGKTWLGVGAIIPFVLSIYQILL